MPRRYFSSTAARTTLSVNIDASVTTMAVAAVSGWPTQFPYTLLVDEGTVNEEIVEVTARSGTTLSVVRGVDGSSAVPHSAGAIVQHGVSARDFDEPNAHVNNSTTAHGLTIANVVTLAGSQTLTNKTMSGASNTFSNIPAAAVVGLSTDYATLTTAQTLTNKTLTAPVSTVATSAQTASYTLVLADASKVVEVSNAGATTLTIPTNASVAFPVGTQILVAQTGAGQVTIAGAAGVTVNGTPGLKLRTQWSVATLVKRAENTWLVAGDVAA